MVGSGGLDYTTRAGAEEPILSAAVGHAHQAVKSVIENIAPLRHGQQAMREAAMRTVGHTRQRCNAAGVSTSELTRPVVHAERRGHGPKRRRAPPASCCRHRNGNRSSWLNKGRAKVTRQAASARLGNGQAAHGRPAAPQAQLEAGSEVQTHSRNSETRPLKERASGIFCLVHFLVSAPRRVSGLTRLSSMELPDGMMLPILFAVMLALLLPVLLRSLSGAPSKRRAPITLKPDAQARALALFGMVAAAFSSATGRRGAPAAYSPRRANSLQVELQLVLRENVSHDTRLFRFALPVRAKRRAVRHAGPALRPHLSS